MEGEKGHPTTIDEYISQFPEDVQHILVEIRAVIKESALDAIEKISYQMPAFYLKGNLVWFAVHKRHIGFYPTASGPRMGLERTHAGQLKPIGPFAEGISVMENSQDCSIRCIHRPAKKYAGYRLVRVPRALDWRAVVGGADGIQEVCGDRAKEVERVV
ncbi:MAG: hypothetical protein M1358_04765 [Chloroflexi bacterium]|nr:hypothetical protein [Chloroflexota bacterium]